MICMAMVLVFAGVGCTQQNATDDIRIGVLLHLSDNPYSDVGDAMREGIDLAVAEQNARGGINGRLVSVIYEDTQYDGTKANAAAQKLINVDDVDAALISTYTEVLSVGPTFEAEKTPLVVLWDSSKEIEDIGDYVFATGAWTESAGSRIAEYAYNDLGLRKIAIVNNNAEWSNAIAGYFTARFTALGGEIVFQESVPESESDFRTLIVKAQQSNPDGIFAPLSTHLDVFFKQTKAAGVTQTLLSADALTQQSIDAAEGTAEGVYYTTIATPTGGNTDRFIEKYRAMYGHDSNLLLFVGMGYDGTRAILHAMEAEGANRESIKNGMYKTQGIEGAFGTISFNEKGSSPRFESVFRVVNGKETFVTD